MLPTLSLLLEEIEVVSSHPVHDKECDSYVPDHEEEAVPPYLGPHGPGLHLGLVVFSEALACIYFLDVGEGSSCGKISFFDDLSLEVPLFGLFFGREEERCVEFTQSLFDGITESVHLNYNNPDQEELPAQAIATPITCATEYKSFLVHQHLSLLYSHLQEVYQGVVNALLTTHSPIEVLVAHLRAKMLFHLVVDHSS